MRLAGVTLNAGGGTLVADATATLVGADGTGLRSSASGFGSGTRGLDGRGSGQMSVALLHVFNRPC